MRTKGIRRFIASVGTEQLPDLLELRLADMVGSGTPHDTSHVDEIREVLAQMQDAGISGLKSSLAVNGKDVMQVLGIGPGPRVGEALLYLQERVLDEPGLNMRDALLAELTQMQSNNQS